MRTLKAVASRVSPVTIKPEAITAGIGEVACKQLDAVCSNVRPQDRFREFGVAIDIVRLRSRSHRVFLKDVQKLAGTLLLLYLIKVGIEAYKRDFLFPDRQAVLRWIGSDPFSILGALEIMTLIFLVVRLIREHAELSDMLD